MEVFFEFSTNRHLAIDALLDKFGKLADLQSCLFGKHKGKSQAGTQVNLSILYTFFAHFQE
jgi:hypothetical protein